VTVSTLFIPTNSKHKPEAWEFLKYLASKEPMGHWSSTVTNLPARKSLLDDPRYEDIKGFSPWLESLKSENLHTFPSTSWSAQYSNDLNTAFDAVNNLKMTPEQAMADVKRKAERYAE
jgi:multiple sugar transport system substrate-binding protein